MEANLITNFTSSPNNVPRVKNPADAECQSNTRGFAAWITRRVVPSSFS